MKKRKRRRGHRPYVAPLANFTIKLYSGWGCRTAPLAPSLPPFLSPSLTHSQPPWSVLTQSSLPCSPWQFFFKLVFIYIYKHTVFLDSQSVSQASFCFYQRHGYAYSGFKASMIFLRVCFNSCTEIY